MSVCKPSSIAVIQRVTSVVEREREREWMCLQVMTVKDREIFEGKTFMNFTVLCLSVKVFSTIVMRYSG